MPGQRTTVFHHNYSENAWLGGTHYFNNLRSVTSRFNPELELCGLNLNALPTRYEGFITRVKLSWHNRVTKKIPPHLVAQGRRNTLAGKAGSNRFCVYSTDFAQIKNLGDVNGIFWIPDFQMFHLPEFFSAEDMEYRKKNYAEGGKLASLVVVSSETAKKDLERFFPELLPKARVLRFVTEVDPLMTSTDPRYVCEKYNLPEKFFYVPNQYWKHKNHMLVIDALAKAIERFPEMHIVFSGGQNDARNPDWTEQLRAAITKYGITKHVTETGIIPKPDVYALMRQCCSMINVSRFEGWSTTVEESKAVGKRMILSDLDVHKEQNPPGGIYVGTDDVAQLANAMCEVWTVAKAGPDVLAEQHAADQLTEKLKDFSRTFSTIIEESFNYNQYK